MFFIGAVRKFFIIRGSWKWNLWIRDITGALEGGWLIRSTKKKGGL